MILDGFLQIKRVVRKFAFAIRRNATIVFFFFTNKLTVRFLRKHQTEICWNIRIHRGVYVHVLTRNIVCRFVIGYATFYIELCLYKHFKTNQILIYLYTSSSINTRFKVDRPIHKGFFFFFFNIRTTVKHQPFTFCKIHSLPVVCFFNFFFVRPNDHYKLKIVSAVINAYGF